ncbi:hypothetical protein AUR64_04055 [Haloprofundus marisrubri]|uniref:Uncharacterized protein n=1 Tax=Haloprofundus marisrubri TaxID=1514971 RepID=A0A0W1RDC4_9EURY|nr:hypothetical protein AUR64_04055 [Haloprofundus marisrubri]
MVVCSELIMFNRKISWNNRRTLELPLHINPSTNMLANRACSNVVSVESLLEDRLQFSMKEYTEDIEE